MGVLFLAVLSGHGAAEESKPAAPGEAAAAAAEPLDRLSAGQMQDVFRLLQQHYIRPEYLTDDELNRAALHGLFARLKMGAVLVERKAGGDGKPAAALNMVSELLTDEVAYLRPGSFTLEEIPKIDVALQGLAKSAAETLLLDLRSPAPDGDFLAAQQLLSRFLPGGQALFEIRRSGGEPPRPMVSKGQPVWTKTLILLVDSETNNVAEVVATVLKARLKPFVIGSQTPGKTVQYREIPVGKELALRLADAEIVVDAGGGIFGKGLPPDFPAPFNAEEKRAVFAASEKEGMKKFVFDAERPRMNEAALVAGSNPELEFQIAKSAQRKTEWDAPPPRDRVVQQALDFLTANRFLKELDAPEIRRAKRK